MDPSNLNLSKERLDRFLSRRRGERPVHAIEPLVFLSRDDFYRRQEQNPTQYKYNHVNLQNIPSRFSEQKRKREELDKENEFSLSEEHKKKLTRIQRGPRTTLHATEEFVIKPYLDDDEKSSPKQQQQQQSETPKQRPTGDKTMANTRQSSVSTRSASSAAPGSVRSIRSSGAQFVHTTPSSPSKHSNNEKAIARGEVYNSDKVQTSVQSAHPATKTTTHSALSTRSSHSNEKNSLIHDDNNVAGDATRESISSTKKPVIEQVLDQQSTNNDTEVVEKHQHVELGQEDDSHDNDQQQKQQHVVQMRMNSPKSGDNIENKEPPKSPLTDAMEHGNSDAVSIAKPLADGNFGAYGDEMPESEPKKMVAQSNSSSNNHNNDMSQKLSAAGATRLDREDDQPHLSSMHENVMDLGPSTFSNKSISKHDDENLLQKSPIEDPAHNDDNHDDNHDEDQNPPDMGVNNDDADDVDFDIEYDYGDDNATNVSVQIDRRATSPQQSASSPQYQQQQQDSEEQQHLQGQDNDDQLSQQGNALAALHKRGRGRVNWDEVAVSNLVSTHEGLDETVMETLRQDVHNAIRILPAAYQNRTFVQTLRELETLAFNCGEEYKVEKDEYYQRASDITVKRIKDAFSYQATLCRTDDELRYKTKRVKVLQDRALKRLLVAQTKRNTLHGETSRLHKACEKLHGTNEIDTGVGEFLDELQSFALSTTTTTSTFNDEL